MNASELKILRSTLLDAVKAIDVTIGGEQTSYRKRKIYDVSPERLADLASRVETRTTLRDAGAKSSAEKLALAQHLKANGWSVRQARLNGVRARYWFAPSDPMN